MKILSRINFAFIAMSLLLMSAAVQAGTYEFQKAEGISIDIPARDDFDAAFGSSTDLPRNDNDIVSLAKKLFPPYKEKHLAAEQDPGSREYETGLLFIALSNPSIQQATRNTADSVIAAAVPPLPKTYTSGHFKFSYTDNDPDPKNNVTLAQIQATATALNAAWTAYASNFREPKHYLSGGKKMINIKVYDLGAGIYGETSSGWNYINLSSHLTVANACKRKTMSAHELFHRVQYAYGYVSGTANMQWMAEGTASWSQKYTNASVGDYISDMISGLKTPARDLLAERSHDAAHFWVYLQKRAGWDAIRDAWQTYSTNGNLAKEAVDAVTRVQLGLSFDNFEAHWIQANYLKDTKNSGLYEYDEDEAIMTSCGVTYGPLNHVQKKSVVSTTNATSWGRNDTLKPYGADYYVFNLDPTLTSIEIKLDGSNAGRLRYYILGIKNNSLLSKTTILVPDNTYSKSLSAGQWDKIVVIAMASSIGGPYTIRINNACFAGRWFDEYSKEWYINQLSTGITGWVTAPICTRWDISGTYGARNMTWTMTGSPNTTLCCNWTFTGTADSTCTHVTGTWTNVNSAPCTGETGSLMISRKANLSAEPLSEEPMIGPMPGLAQQPH